jgi:UDPglucose--hexose-1-phosphate uridylyltransferase
MQELRKDPIHGRWVIIAAERNNRPTDYSTVAHPGTRVSCPFCSGNEVHTPPEVLSYRNSGGPDEPGWRVRVVPNKYPALQSQGGGEVRREGLFESRNAIGAHEVVIETPHHDVQFPDLGVDAIEEVLQAYIDRIRALRQDRRFHYVMVFKNQGPQAGATLEHTHSQIIATPVVPHQVQEELDGSRRHHARTGHCLFCDILAQESNGERWIDESEGIVALSPFAARFPFETWILPHQHAPHFEDLEPTQRRALALTLGKILRRLHQRLNQPPYNLVFHTAPCNESDSREYYHWHIEIMPKLTQPAGFEWGSGFYINPMSPEQAASLLRRPDDPPAEPASAEGN